MTSSPLRMPAAAAALLLLGSFLFPVGPARAELVVSQLIAQLQPGKKMREDIEVWNNSNERAFVMIEPAEVINPGQPSESRRRTPDPESLGLLVSPARLILEPGQRRLVRVAVLGVAPDRERVYRVTIRPVVAEGSVESGLTILIGYDVLVLVRPAEVRRNVSGFRSGDRLTIRNDGNASIELLEGRQCDTVSNACVELPSKRLYPGAEWSQTLRSPNPAEYLVDSGGRRQKSRF